MGNFIVLHHSVVQHFLIDTLAGNYNQEVVSPSNEVCEAVIIMSPVMEKLNLKHNDHVIWKQQAAVYVS